MGRGEKGREEGGGVKGRRGVWSEVQGRGGRRGEGELNPHLMKPQRLSLSRRSSGETLHCLRLW